MSIIRWPLFIGRGLSAGALGLIAACAEPSGSHGAPESALGPAGTETARGEAAAEAVGTGIARNPLRNAYFGDLHVHTRNSYDAYLFNVRATPDDAYAYAKGEAIAHPMGFELRLGSGPLDFLAVTDHAEYLGVLEAIDTPGTAYSRVPYAGELFSSDRAQVVSAFGRFVDSLLAGERMPELSDMSAPRSAWRETIESAERHYAPGELTTFIGYEFTSLPEMRNLHRNVLFSGSAAPPLPFSALDSQNPEDLWRWLDALRGEGMEALAIPHNSNASDGAMFAHTKWNGEPIDVAYAELRMRNEPLAEIIQTKGQSETMPLLSPNDELAGFEVMELYVGSSKPVTTLAGGYVRDALRTGLEIGDEIGANPYRMGVVGGSDGHNAAAPYEEDGYFANHGVLDGRPELRGGVPPGNDASWDEYYAEGGSAPRIVGTGGLTGVWAEANTRESIFAALRRKETFATSGPRIRVRMFAGYDLNGLDLTTNEGVRAAYARGVPMGGDLVGEPGETPELIVIAMRDVHSAPLERIQVVKGWTEGGASFERVYDVACADGGAVDPETRRCPDSGASVDLATCEIDEGKGDNELGSIWRDPDFDPDESAFYYARVIEIPTCRWSTWDAVRARVEPNPALDATIRERAYTSPIWYAPVGRADR